mmetsp:Transcript_323/g.1099  ORF Transcript_323/g.1099 Transcript_323/m.1099 type:complete len:130 (+) Transcript_323:82-471(+)
MLLPRSAPAAWALRRRAFATASPMRCAMHASRPLLGFFENQFSKPGPLRTSQKRRSLLWVWAVFSCPTFLVLFGNHPDIQDWFIHMYKPVEYPPQCDPHIIYEVFHGRQPKGSSMDSYNAERRALSGEA